MKRPNRPLAIPAFLLASIVVLASCTSEPKAPPTAAAPVVQSKTTTLAELRAGGNIAARVTQALAILGEKP